MAGDGPAVHAAGFWRDVESYAVVTLTAFAPAGKQPGGPAFFAAALISIKGSDPEPNAITSLRSRTFGPWRFPATFRYLTRFSRCWSGFRAIGAKTSRSISQRYLSRWRGPNYQVSPAMLDEAVGKFAVSFAVQTERDYELFAEAKGAGLLKVASVPA